MSSLRRLTLLWRTYTPVEEAILAAVVEALAHEPGELMQGQIRAINKVQRTLEWTEINFYCIRLGKVRWPETVAFLNKGEFKLATIDYELAGRPFRTELWAISGHIFSFITRPSLKASWAEKPLRVEVTLEGDPSSPIDTRPDVLPYLPKSFLAMAQAHSLPGQIHDWNVPKPNETHIVHLPEGDFVFLASRDGGEYLLAPMTPGNNQIYYLDESSSLTPVGEDLLQAMNR